VKTKKKPEQKDKAAEQSYRWQHCALSQAPLQQPVVVCEMGRIFNKDAIIEALLNKTAEESATPAPVTISHIKTLRDVKTLNLTENPAWTEASQKGDGYNDNNKARWVCPITAQEMNGFFRFVCLWTCGCVFSEKAMKEITVHDCLKCQKPFSIDDIIVLNPTEEDEISTLRTRMELRRSKAKDMKKAKKIVKEGSKAPASSISGTSATSALHSKEDTQDPKPKNGHVIPSSSSNGKRPAKVDKLETKDSKLSKISGSYSVAKDPNVSTTYKSLFTSSETATSQERAHWVTYNPFYN